MLGQPETTGMRRNLVGFVGLDVRQCGVARWGHARQLPNTGFGSRRKMTRPRRRGALRALSYPAENRPVPDLATTLGKVTATSQGVKAEFASTLLPALPRRRGRTLSRIDHRFNPRPVAKGDAKMTP